MDHDSSPLLIPFIAEMDFNCFNFMHSYISGKSLVYVLFIMSANQKISWVLIFEAFRSFYPQNFVKIKK